MNLRLVLSVVLCLTAAGVAQTKPSNRPPNVIVIVADDLGYADTGFQGIVKDIQTPHLDALAASGVRFTNGYVSCPVCSPSRAGLLTGRYQQRFGHEENPTNVPTYGLPTTEITFADVMKKQGYATGAIGKWHLGQLEQYRPLHRGFDEFFGFLGGLHRYINLNRVDTGPNALRRGDEPVAEPDYMTDAISREAVAFIDRHSDKPFFLYVPYNAVHVPQQAPPRYRQIFKDVTDERRMMMLAMMYAEDLGVGKITDTLRSKHLDKNTIVFFFSDNGGPPGNGTRNTPLRGHKAETFEGGIRVPFCISWPGVIPTNGVDDRPVISLDIMPTAVAAAGGAMPSDRPIDGVNLLPFLTQNSTQPIHEALFWRYGQKKAMREGDFKLQWNEPELPHLYNLAKDIGETTDLAGSDPRRLAEMKARYAAWNTQMVEPLWHAKSEMDPEDGDEPTTKPTTK